MKLFTAATAAILTATTAFAAPECASNQDVEDILTQRYGESPMVAGVDVRGMMVVWWGNPDTGSWTATVTNGDMTCIVAQGVAMQEIDLPPNV